MIIESTVDLARLKVNVSKFLKWFVKNYRMTYRILSSSDSGGESNFIMSDTLKSDLREKGIKNLSIDYLGTAQKEFVPLSGFIMKNYPKYMSIGIDPLNLVVTRTRLDYKQDGKSVEKMVMGKYHPFKYGLELHPGHKGDIDIFRIDKETSVIQTVRYSPKASTKKLKFGSFYTLDYFILKELDKGYNSSYFHSAVNTTLPYSVDLCYVYVESINFTKELPIEKEIMEVTQ